MKILQKHSNDLTNLYDTKLNVETHEEDMSKVNDKIVSLIFKTILFRVFSNINLTSKQFYR